MEHHLVPALGRVKLAKLSPAQVQEYLGQASTRLAPQTVRHHRAVLRRAPHRLAPMLDTLLDGTSYR